MIKRKVYNNPGIGRASGVATYIAFSLLPPEVFTGASSFTFSKTRSRARTGAPQPINDSVVDAALREHQFLLIGHPPIRSWPACVGRRPGSSE